MVLLLLSKPALHTAWIPLRSVPSAFSLLIVHRFAAPYQVQAESARVSRLLHVTSSRPTATPLDSLKPPICLDAAQSLVFTLVPRLSPTSQLARIVARRHWSTVRWAEQRTYVASHGLALNLLREKKKSDTAVNILPLAPALDTGLAISDDVRTSYFLSVTGSPSITASASRHHRSNSKHAA